MKKVIKVGMADLQVACSNCVLTTYGLGSCVGVALYDHQKKIIGLAHIMLPSSKKAKNKSNAAKFVDTAVDKLLKEMINIGASRERVTAKLVGGSQMFSSAYLCDISKIGHNNVLSAKKKLEDLDITVVSEDTGGNYGRTLEFNSDDGNLIVKTIEHGIKQI
ncbi:MAG: chemotaxis protein CheD [Clostridia bacterium]|jgi:chemotaxis protein CheD